VFTEHNRNVSRSSRPYQVLLELKTLRSNKQKQYYCTL